MVLTDTGAVAKPRPSGWQAAGLLAAGIGEIGAGALGEAGGAAADSTGIGAAGGIALGAVSFMAIKDGIDKFGSGFDGALGSSHHPPAATTVTSSNDPSDIPGKSASGSATPPQTAGQSGSGGQSADGPHSRLVPGGGLEAHEGVNGGHTLDPDKAHVGATDEQMADRLLNDPKKPKSVSSFYDRATAERSISENIEGNQDGIDKWKQSAKDGALQGFNHDDGHNVGRQVTRDNPDQVSDVSRSRVVLKRDSSNPEGYTIYTAYPN